MSGTSVLEPSWPFSANQRWLSRRGDQVARGTQAALSWTDEVVRATDQVEILTDQVHWEAHPAVRTTDEVVQPSNDIVRASREAVQASREVVRAGIGYAGLTGAFFAAAPPGTTSRNSFAWA